MGRKVSDDLTARSGANKLGTLFIIDFLVNRPFSIAALLLVPVLFAGCDRGSHPELVGRPAPQFTVQDDEHSVSLRELRGKIVVLNFWATWCPPCVEETPALVAMQNRLRDRGVIVLAVSTDEDVSAYKRFKRERMAGLLTVRDGEQRSNALYGTSKYPETYIIDKEGVLRRKFIGPVDWTNPEIIDYLTRL